MRDGRFGPSLADLVRALPGPLRGGARAQGFLIRPRSPAPGPARGGGGAGPAHQLAGEVQLDGGHPSLPGQVFISRGLEPSPAHRLVWIPPPLPPAGRCRGRTRGSGPSGTSAAASRVPSCGWPPPNGARPPHPAAPFIVLKTQPISSNYSKLVFKNLGQVDIFIFPLSI